ncbi:hypothetical protein [Morganella morganii]|uniref:hypothetical protein n=1 Tax=Morganella morganii TaxID=582 RepID=UPI000662AE5A|nr:hypothetical protein [Morganella morganii]HCR3994013.1 hypothetical protein [Morganella morganii]
MKNIFKFDEYEMILTNRMNKLVATIHHLNSSDQSSTPIHADNVKDLITQIKEQLSINDTTHLYLDLMNSGYK